MSPTDPDQLIPLVRTLSLAAALDAEEAAAVANAVLVVIATEPESAIDETVRRIARERAGTQGGQRSPLLALPPDAAARAAGPELDLEAVFGEVEAEAASFMLLEAANRLPVRYRVPLLLFLVEGLGPGDIAEITGGAADETDAILTAALRLYEREIRFAIGEAS